MRSNGGPVVVSGIGVWCGFGRGLECLDRAMRAGLSAAAPISSARVPFSARAREFTACSIRDADYFALAEKDPTVLTSLAIEVAADALRDAGHEIRSLKGLRMGICLGTTLGGGLAFLSHYEGRHGVTGGREDAIVSACTPASIVGVVADFFSLCGPTLAISTACAASANAVGRGADLIRHGHADAMLVGGVDLYSELSVSGFNSLQALAKSKCRAFEDDRDGLILGDSGAILVLERLDAVVARGSHAYAELGGHATANEAFHATGPDPSGAGALSVMARAIRASGLEVSDIGYVNAHGTGTRANDAMEAQALRDLFGDGLATVDISSTKPATGHTLGAAGALEAIVSCLAIRGGYVPVTSGEAGESLEFGDLPIARGPVRRRTIHAALSNSFGFGGNVASLVLKSLD